MIMKEKKMEVIILEPIVRFLKEKVMGKALCTEEITEQAENGKFESVSEDKITFSNLVAWDDNLRFDFFVISSEVTYELDYKKQRIGIQKDFNGAALFRYELVKRKSTGEFTGVMRFISSTGENNVEAVISGLFDVRLKGDKLSWKEEQMLYRDHPGENGGFCPKSFDAQNSLYIENGKLRFEYIGFSFDIDGDTFEKRAAKSVFPDFIALEK